MWSGKGKKASLPSYHGEPVTAQVPDLDAPALAQAVWDALDKDNRVSLYVCVDGNEVIINKHGGEDEIK